MKMTQEKDKVYPQKTRKWTVAGCIMAILLAVPVVGMILIILGYLLKG